VVWHSLRRVRHKEPARQEALDALLGYLDRQADRLDYPTYERFGYPISSGPMESFCKQLGQRLKGPGMFFIIPIIESVAQGVDMRIRATDFSSESTLTKDTVPVNVDAICFWMAWDAKKAVLEVQNFYQAIILSAQTALRDIIGTHELADMLTHRGELGKRLREILDEKTNPWGISVQSVEIRDIIIPKDLEAAMSKQAQAERERQARIILSTAETEIADKFAEAAKKYERNPGAMHLRGMNMLFEGLKEKGSMIIVPSSALETMNLGAIGGLAALSQVKNEKEDSTEEKAK
jgi:regulator of protease activity HflC (stomatin/prohibitin superfamily)